MAFDIKKVEYYNISVENHAGEGSKLLSLFAGVGVNLLAFKAVFVEPMRTRFTLFPNDGLKMTIGAKKAGLELDGPHARSWPTTAPRPWPARRADGPAARRRP